MQTWTPEELGRLVIEMKKTVEAVKGGGELEATVKGSIYCLKMIEAHTFTTRPEVFAAFAAFLDGFMNGRGQVAQSPIIIPGRSN